MVVCKRDEAFPIFIVGPQYPDDDKNDYKNGDGHT